MDKPVKMDWGWAVGSAYAALRDNIVACIIIVTAWGAIGFTVVKALSVLAPAIFELFPDVRYADPDLAVGLAAAFIGVPLFVIAVAGAITLAVSFHRIIVMEHTVRSPFPVSARDILRYAWRLIVVSAPYLLPIIVMVLVLYLAGPADKTAREATAPYFVGAIALVMLCGLLVLGRLSIVLPATAVGDTTMTLAKAWQTTKGHSWRIFWGTVVCALPFNIVGKLIEKSQANFEDGSAGFFVTLFAGFVVDSMCYAVAAAFFSYTYLHFRRDET